MAAGFPVAHRLRGRPHMTPNLIAAVPAFMIESPASKPCDERMSAEALRRARATLLMLMVLTGCATARNIAQSRRLTGCAEPAAMQEIAAQSAETGMALEPVPELTWYRGCGRTL